VGRIGQRCDFCGSSQIVPYDEIKVPFRPESLLPLKISETDVRNLLKAWIKKVWFAPNNISKLSNTDVLKGFYLPFLDIRCTKPRAVECTSRLLLLHNRKLY
jgi:hypothetical protein